MEIIEVSPREYGNLVDSLDIPIFNKSNFLELNKDKVDKIHYLIGKDKKNRIAFAIGEKNSKWSAPFSAPFSNIVILKKDLAIEYIWDFFGKLKEFVQENGGKSINIYLPANVYGEKSNSRTINAMLGNGFKIQFVDVNYSFQLNEFTMDSYESILQYNAKKNLRISLQAGLVFEICKTRGQKEEAYDVIKINRENRGFPLRMTKEQVMSTIEVVDHDFFLVKKEGKSVAAAVVYRLTNKIAQVVYWGDIPNVGEYKTINFISYNLIMFYKSINFEILDIGISTEEGIPNYGLCNFKESLGCISSSKYRLMLEV